MDEKLQTLINAGGKLWEKNGMSRIYFNASLIGLDISRYKTGNISSATLNGDSISNSEAGRIEMIKIWFDAKDGQFHTSDLSGLRSSSREAVQSFIDGLKAKIQ